MFSCVVSLKVLRCSFFLCVSKVFKLLFLRVMSVIFSAKGGKDERMGFSYLLLCFFTRVSFLFFNVK